MLIYKLIYDSWLVRLTTNLTVSNLYYNIYDIVS